MTKEEIKILKELEPIKEKVLTEKDLSDKTGHTLLYGKTKDGKMFHVYMDGHITVVKYDPELLYDFRYVRDRHFGIEAEREEIIVKSNADYVPDAIFYPECCDFDFCRLLKLKGYEFTFAEYDKYRSPEKYYGLIY